MEYTQAVNLNNMGLYYQNLTLSLPPFLSETYFPSQVIGTNALKYLTSATSVPALADAAQPDGHVLPTNNDSFQENFMQTQFFRVESVTNEQDVMDINTALNTGNDQYLETVVRTLFDHKTKDLLRMRTRREWLGMQALINGKIHMVSNGIRLDLDYNNRPDFTTTAGGDWSDPNYKGLFKDIRQSLKLLSAYAIFPNQIIMNSNTFDWIRHNQVLKDSVPSTNLNIANGELTQTQVVDYIRSEYHLNVVVYDQGYFDEQITADTPNVINKLHPYIPDGKIVMMSAPLPPAPWLLSGSTSAVAPVAGGTSVIGHMNFAPTPELLGLQSGRYNSGEVAIFDTGVAYHEYQNDKFNREEDITAMNVMPSLEGNNQIFRMTVSPQQNDSSNSNGSTNNGNTNSGNNGNASTGNNGATTNPPKA